MALFPVFICALCFEPLFFWPRYSRSFLVASPKNLLGLETPNGANLPLFFVDFGSGFNLNFTMMRNDLFFPNETFFSCPLANSERSNCVSKLGTRFRVYVWVWKVSQTASSIFLYRSLIDCALSILYSLGKKVISVTKSTKKSIRKVIKVHRMEVSFSFLLAITISNRLTVKFYFRRPR